jgi:hypothetical protein
MIISFFLRGIRKDCEESGLTFKHHQLASEITITSWLAGWLVGGLVGCPRHR